MSGKVTRIRKDRSNQAKTGQFKNIVNAARTRKISLGNAQDMIKKLVKAKKSGGVIRANSGKSVKDGKILSTKEKNEILLAKAKKKINDPNYNVASGEIQKNKNNQTNVKKNIKDAKIRKKERLDKNTKVVNTGRPNENKRVLKKGNFGEDIQKLIGLTPAGFLRKKAVKNIFNMFKSKKTPSSTTTKQIRGPKKVNVSGGGGSGTRGQGSGRFITQRKNRPTGTQVAKPKNTQLKKPSTSLVNRPKQNKVKPSSQPFLKSVGDIAIKGSLISNPSIANENKINKPKITKPKKAPITKVKTEKLKKMGPTKDYTGKFVNKKGEVAYDSVGDFFRNITGTAKKRERPENRKRIQSATKGATKGIGFSGKSVGNPFKFNSGGKMVKRAAGGLKPVPEGNKGLGKLPSPVRNKMGYMRKGGVVKMRGGGAATKGMNFNRGY
tara:strand:- start:40 stop:1353 length:1314 start_codon:yes stop_codon:yes gene_type:complete